MARTSIGLLSDTFNEDTDEARLIQAARQDPRLFGELYQVYVKQVFRYLYSRTGNVQEAEDLTAQTFLAAFEAFHTFRQNGRFAPWLFTIARNKAFDHFRRRKPIAPLEAGSEMPADTELLNGVIQSEHSAELAALIQALPEEERELLRLRYLATMSFGEIGLVLRRREDTVKKTLYRLLARLREQLEVAHE